MNPDIGNPREHELTCVAASLAAGCVPCTRYHARAVRQAGAPEEDIRAAATVGLSVKQAALDTMADLGAEHFGLSAKPATAPPGAPPNPLVARIALAAAAAANCAPVLRARLETATGLGLQQDQINRALQVGRFIREQAARHVDVLWAPQAAPQEAPPCCGRSAPEGSAAAPGGACG